MKTQFHNLVPVKRIKDVLGYDWSKTSNFMHGFKHKEVDGMKLLDVQIWKNTSEWDGLVEQTIADDGTVTMRITEEHAEGQGKTYHGATSETYVSFIDNFLTDNIFHAFIHGDVEVEREKMVRVKMGAGYAVRKMVKVVREPGYLYGQYKIVSAEQDVKTGDYIFVAKPQHIPA